MTYVPPKFEVAMANGYGDAFTRKYIFWPQGQAHQGHTKCCSVPSTSCDLCPSKVWCCYILGLRRRCIYKRIHYLTLTLGQGHMKCCPVPSTSCDLCTYRVWSYFVKRFRRRCIYKCIHYLTFGLVSRSHKMMASTLYVMWHIQLQRLKLLRLTV